MVNSEPIYNFLLEFIYKIKKFVRFSNGNGTYAVILCNVSLGPAGIEVIGVYFVFITQYKWQCLDGSVMLQGSFCFVSLGI